MTALHTAIAEINGGGRYRHVWGDITIDDPLPEITGGGVLDLRGAFIQSNLPASAPPLLTSAAWDLTVEGGQFAFAHPQDVFYFRDGGHTTWRDAVVRGCGTVARFGGPNAVTRCTVRGIKGRFHGTGSLFYIAHGGNQHVKDCEVNGIGRNFGLITIKPAPGGFCDTTILENLTLQSFVLGNAGSGSTFGLSLDTQHGKIVNTYVQNVVCDHTTNAGLRFIGPTGGSDLIRFVRANNFRNHAALGRNIVALARGRPFEDIQINFPRFHCRAGKPANTSLGPRTNVSIFRDAFLRTA